MTHENSSVVDSVGVSDDAEVSENGALATSAGQGVSAWLTRYEESLFGVFGTPKSVLVRGEGCSVWDADGKKYLDLLAGIAVNTLGHGHPTLTAAISAQLGTLGHVSNFFTTAPQIALAEKLLEISGAPLGSRVFFSNSGTEANESAFKMARRNNDGGTRTRILALEGSFHGRSMGALALTSKEAYRAPFEPLPGGVEFIAPTVEALEAVFAEGSGSQIAALFAEPIQGETGVVPLPTGFLKRARELTSEAGALLILDEVQTGMGRTGLWLAHHHHDLGEGITPDVVTLAKGLGGGIPIGATIAYGERVAKLLSPGQHGTTFGGNPIAAAAALATIFVIERDQLLSQVSVLGSSFHATISQAITAGDLVGVTGSRGKGLHIGIQLTDNSAGAVADAALAAGFIVNAVNPSTVRLAPPFIVTAAELASFLTFLKDHQHTAAAAQSSPSIPKASA